MNKQQKILIIFVLGCYLLTPVASQCLEKEYQDGNGDCQPCQQGCSKCTLSLGNYKCTECEAGDTHYVDRDTQNCLSCADAIDNCNECETNSQYKPTCTKCDIPYIEDPDDYGLKTCTRCHEFCDFYEDCYQYWGEIKCSRCQVEKANYQIYQDNNFCIDCPADCKGMGCKKTDALGLYCLNGCRYGDDFPYMQDAMSSIQYYYQDDDLTKCKECPAKCFQCAQQDQSSPVKCTKCVNSLYEYFNFSESTKAFFKFNSVQEYMDATKINFYKNPEGSCLACPIGCASCIYNEDIQGPRCLVCFQNYFLGFNTMLQDDVNLYAGGTKQFREAKFTFKGVEHDSEFLYPNDASECVPCPSDCPACYASNITGEYVCQTFLEPEDLNPEEKQNNVGSIINISFVLLSLILALYV